MGVTVYSQVYEVILYPFIMCIPAIWPTAMLKF